MRKLICFINGHVWTSTNWYNDNPNDNRYYIYCSRCYKKEVTHA